MGIHIFFNLLGWFRFVFLGWFRFVFWFATKCNSDTRIQIDFVERPINQNYIFMVTILSVMFGWLRFVLWFRWFRLVWFRWFRLVFFRWLRFVIWLRWFRLVFFRWLRFVLWFRWLRLVLWLYIVRLRLVSRLDIKIKTLFFAISTR